MFLNSLNKRQPAKFPIFKNMSEEYEAMIYLYISILIRSLIQKINIYSRNILNSIQFLWLYKLLKKKYIYEIYIQNNEINVF